MRWQARGKATTVPEVGRGLPCRLADRKTAGDAIGQFKKAEQALKDGSQKAAGNWTIDVTRQLICPVDGNIYPFRGSCRKEWLRPRI